MRQVLRLGFFFSLAAVLFTATGCANKKTSKINALEAQVGVLTDEMARLDQSLQEVRGSLAMQQGGSAAGASYAAGGGHVYRTPSGFELPSLDIQKALKNAGYYQGGVDGKIGSSTKTALKAFQRDNGLTADGVCGRQTW